METKKCFKCGKEKPLSKYYKHKDMGDGHLNKCISCTRKDVKENSKSIKRKCEICGKKFGTCKTEIKRGGGKYCSRDCYYKSQRNEGSYNWKGSNASYTSKHKWVYRRLGKPKYCEKCGIKEDKIYHWASKSGECKRDLEDWIRLCPSCHKKYDLKKRDYIEVECVVCGKKIKTKSKKRMFCSSRCSSEYYRNKNK